MLQGPTPLWLPLSPPLPSILDPEETGPSSPPPPHAHSARARGCALFQGRIAEPWSHVPPTRIGGFVTSQWRTLGLGPPHPTCPGPHSRPTVVWASKAESRSYYFCGPGSSGFLLGKPSRTPQSDFALVASWASSRGDQSYGLWPPRVAYFLGSPVLSMPTQLGILAAP